MHEIYFVYPSQRVLHEVQMRKANEERPLWRATDERRKKAEISYAYFHDCDAVFLTA